MVRVRAKGARAPVVPRRVSMALGSAIQAYRDAEGITRLEFAARAGLDVAEQTMYRWERSGEVHPAHVPAILAAMDAPPDVARVALADLLGVSDACVRVLAMRATEPPWDGVGPAVALLIASLTGADAAGVRAWLARAGRSA